MMKLKRMRGIADPYSLGIIISILGAIVVNIIHSTEPEPIEEAVHVTMPTTHGGLANAEANEHLGSASIWE